MYKTIRHGENSLQYTILPQNDDFRMDGKLSSNSASSSIHKPKRGRRRSFFAYLGLLFVCTVIVGAILIPFLVSAECLPSPSDWFIRTKLIEHERPNVTKINKTESTIKAYLEGNLNAPSTETATTVVKIDDNTTKDTINIFTVPVATDRAHESDNNSELASIITTTGLPPINKVPLDIPVARSTQSSTITIVRMTEPITTSTTTKLINVNGEKDMTGLLKTRTSSVVQVIPTVQSTTLTPQLLSTSSKKPIILPVLAKTNSVIRENGKLVDRQSEPKNWIRSHWPFIDPSTYFQWAGYKSEDSVLLPAILGVALIGMILIITLCLVARNKKTIVASVRKRNRNDVEEAGEDNTTLLRTGSYVSDED